MNAATVRANAFSLALETGSSSSDPSLSEVFELFLDCVNQASSWLLLRGDAVSADRLQLLLEWCAHTETVCLQAPLKVPAAAAHVLEQRRATLERGVEGAAPLRGAEAFLRAADVYPARLAEYVTAHLGRYAHLVAPELKGAAHVTAAICGETVLRLDRCGWTPGAEQTWSEGKEQS